MKLLITAGPTREPIDDVRYISNRSSGKLGVAIAEAGIAAGYEVTLLMGAGADWESVKTLDKCEVVKFESTADLQTLLEKHFPTCDTLIMAAAVSDYRPASVTKGKLQRGDDNLQSINLEPTPDLVAGINKVKQPHQKIISFSLEEPEKLIERATAKMHKKGVDATVANPLKTMDSDSIEPTWLTPDGNKDQPGEMSKTDFARWLIDKL